MNMVLAERNSEIMRNGRRSRGPSPNGHGGTPDSSSDEDNNSIKKNGSKSKTKQSEYEEKIRVGRDYQATCPDLIPLPERKPELLPDRALLVWSPTKDIPDDKLEEYISVAKEKYGYNGEQALGMLFWHKHDLERAVMDLANFTPFPDEWTVEDKVLFEQAFQFHGKSFHRIRQMLPDKSIASLVKYYYSWKKTRHRQSVMDRQEKAKLKDGGSDNGSENGSNEESDNDEKDQFPSSSNSIQDPQKQSSGPGNSEQKNLSSLSSKNQANQNQSSSSNAINVGGGGGGVASSSSKRQHLANTSATAVVAAANVAQSINQGGTSSINLNSDDGNTASVTSSLMPSTSTAGAGCCTGCGVSCNQVNGTPHGNLCNSCYHHWRRTGTKRPTTGPYFGKRFRDRNAERHKRKPPRGMHINHDDIVALASSNSNQDELLANTEREIISLLSQVQQNKQHLSSLKRKISDSSEDLRPTEQNNRINSRWNNDEVLLAVQGIRKFGKNFQAIAETIGTKTETHIRTFFVNYRRRYNLDAVLKEYEAEQEAQQQQKQQQQQQSTTTTTTTITGSVSTAMANNSNNNTENIQQQNNNEIEVIDISSSSTPITPTQLTNASQQQQQQQQQQQLPTSQQQLKPTATQEKIIMEIDLDNEPSLDIAPAKKPCLSILNEPVKTI